MRKKRLKSISSFKFILSILVIFLAILVMMVYIGSRPSVSFPINNDISIPNNSSLSRIANDLAKKGVISSPFLFKVAVVISGGQKGLFAGDYRLINKESIFRIAYRMVKGIQGLPKIKITIPEGTNSYDMAYIYMNKLSNFNAPKFLGLALENEGYLFPDTYYFLSNTKPEAIIKEMKANFQAKIKPIESEISVFGKPLKDIITMASIIEEEANTNEDRSIVSGVLWKRIAKGMPLQVDPPFYYITGKSSGVLFEDLKVDSPYNTYKYKGLPKGPISNPGIRAIKAAVNPISTPYFFYLTGKDGFMKYAIDFDGHITNRNKYLK